MSAQKNYKSHQVPNSIRAIRQVDCINQGNSLPLQEPKIRNKCNVIKNADVDQRLRIAVKNWLEKNGFLIIGKKETLPYSPVLSLNEKGKKIAEHLMEIEKIIEP